MLDVFYSGHMEKLEPVETTGIEEPDRWGGWRNGMFASEWRWLGTRTTTSVNLGDTSYSSGDKCVLIALQEDGTSAMTP